MNMKFGRIILFYFLIEYSEGFFNGDVSTLVNKTINRLNLTCFYYGDYISNSEYCAYQYFSNGSSSTTLYDYMQITNIYKSISQRCTGFSNTTDIGYGSCSPLPFELFNSSILCICATDMCNVNLTTCQASVNYQLQTNTTPSVLHSIIPELEKSISCFDTAYPSYSTLYCIELASPYIDIAKCNEYMLSNTVLCMMHVSVEEVNSIAVPRDFYKYYLSGALDRVNRFNRDPSKTLFYNETVSSFYLNYNVTQPTGNNTNTTDFTQRCFCLVNNCNQNLTTCLMAKGINSASKDSKNIYAFLFLYLIIKFLFVFEN